MSNKMQIESIMFDYRLYAERGLPSYFHHHDDGKRIDQCEIQFLNKVRFIADLLLLLRNNSDYHFFDEHSSYEQSSYEQTSYEPSSDERSLLRTP